MSVNQTNYIVYGLKIPYEDFKKIEEPHEDDYDWWDNNTIGNVDEDAVGFLVDGMSGQYCLIGRKIYSADVYDDDGNPVEIDVLTPKECLRVKEEAEKFLGYKLDKLSYYFVSHYS